MKSFHLYLLTLILLLSPVMTLAQQPPDSGDILRETLPQQLSPLAPSVELDISGDPLQEAVPGGPTVILTGITFSGNSLYSADELLAVVADTLGTQKDLAGLRHIANRISHFYRNNDYPFARALLPQQRMDDGVLQLVIYEGVYGDVATSGDAALAAKAQGFLGRLKPGTPIKGATLERATLLLGDLPGISIVPIMRPGSDPGTGNLDVRVSSKPRFGGGIGIDNHGSRYSGAVRGSLDLFANRLLLLGDQLTLRGIYSQEDLWLGQAAYALPLGTSGLKGRMSYARTEYDLRSPYSGFTGVADIFSSTISYPLVRSQRSNLLTSVTYQYKEMDDRFGGSSYQKKRSHSVPVALQFDHRDGLGGGGVSYGSLTLTTGSLDNNAPGAIDGSFFHSNLQLARIQALPSNLTLFVGARGQWTDDDLDSSENFTLGGAAGIRAFPQGEASGARAWLSQIELRYRYQNLTPYLFYDAGQRLNYRNDQQRTLSGGGAGLRYDDGRFHGDVAVAFKGSGGDATSDDKQRDPRVWVRAGVRF